MMKRVLQLAVVCALFVCAGPVGAEFRASDQVYVPVVAHNLGLDGSLWRSDVTITNVEDEDTIDVAIAFLPSGLYDNSPVFSTREGWLGGREGDSFGIIEEQLASIPPGGTVILEDIVGEYWPDNVGTNGQGALIVFAYLSGSLDDMGGRELRNVIVTSRTYNFTTVWVPDEDNEGEFLETTATYSQTIAGVPWYNLADSAFYDEEAGVDFASLIIDGAKENEDFRFNLGILNTSDRQTTIILLVEIFQLDGTSFENSEGIPISFETSIPPLAHIQYNQVLNTLFGETEVDHARFRISISSWQTNGTVPKPTFTAYGSLVDNTTSDPSTLGPTFKAPYNVECMWPTPETEEKDAGVVDGRSRALAIPAA